LQLLLFSGLAFFVMLPWLKRTLTITLDTDWVYRVFLPALAMAAGRGIGGIQKGMLRGGAAIGARLSIAIRRHQRADGFLMRSRPTSVMAFWAMLVLLAYLIVNYIQ